MKFEKQSFSNQEINLDGNEFLGCKFNKCKVVYQGFQKVALSNCAFSNCSFSFAGAAANTILFMTNMYSGGFEDLIEATLNNIRKNVTGGPMKLGYN